MVTPIQFRQRTAEIIDLKSILSTLSWDQETMMPPRGSEIRARQCGLLSSLYHRKLVSPEIGEMLDELEQQPDLDEWYKASVRELRREYEKAVRVPEKLVRELAETTSLAYQHWVDARRMSDFRHFAPWLKKVLDLKREQASYFEGFFSPYEALLDDFEPGMKVEEVAAVFERLRPRLAELLQKVVDSPLYQSVPSLEDHYDLASQEALGREVLTAIGFNWEAGRLDRSPHPFCTGLNPNDVRITTRFYENDFRPSLFGILHEGGHALYEQGLSVEHYGLPACEAISLGIHESQSRLWENLVGRSRPFWRHWFSRLKEVYPSLRRLELDPFLRAVNFVEASPIRVEADEVSYGLHIILRFELEKRMIDDGLEVEALPDLWNQGMQEYLGIRPANDAEGILQDTHWSQGLIGYFPTYLLGNLYAAQIFEKAQSDLGNLDELIARGKFLPLRDWLSEQIFSKGRTRSATALIEEITGSPLDAQHFIDYLHKKFGDLYGI
ncbi:MAG TPA: carboxypeptidase M32 [Acidobacteriota bacterium]|nr:carboxypeptidase M32 [Acidobacteriota bacterium]